MDTVLLTVAYADVFDFPLTREELSRWMIFGGKAPKEKKEFYYLRKSTVAVRSRRSIFQKKKWEIAQRAASILSKIPYVEMVGVTGGLAMNNAKADDDIDLFIVTAAGRLWTTRLLSILLLWRMRRKRRETNVKNKVCLNMFTAADHLEIDEKDLFSAHEVLQMEPIFDRDDTYKKFLRANAWVQRFLPNAWKQVNYELRIMNNGEEGTNSIIHNSLFMIPAILEKIAMMLQLWYMKKHRTREVITDATLRFHPNDARIWVKKKLSDRLKRYHIPLDKNIWSR